MTPQRTACWAFSAVATVSAATLVAWLFHSSWLLMILLPLIAGLAAFWTCAKLIARPRRSGIHFAAVRGAAVAACSYLLTNGVLSLLFGAGHLGQLLSSPGPPSVAVSVLESLSLAGYSLAVGVGLFGWAAVAIGAITGIMIERYVLKTI